MHNVAILIKTVFNKNFHHYYYKVFLLKIHKFYIKIELIFLKAFVNKTSASKECIICHYWYVLDESFTLQPTLPVMLA